MKRQLSLILVAFVGLSLLYNALIPPFEGPDEFEHFAYVQWLAAGKGFPPQGAAAWQTEMRQEASQPPLFYLLAAVPASFLTPDPPVTFRPNPHFQYLNHPTLPDNKNSAIHYPTDTHPLRGSWLILYLSRLVSTLSGCWLIIAVYGLAQLILPNQPYLWLSAAALVAGTPQIIFHSSLVTNDILAAALSTTTLWLWGRTLQQGVTMGRTIGVGLVFGLATLSKISTLVVGLPLFIGSLYLAKKSFKSALQAVIGITLGAVITAGWWFGHSWILYGSPLGLESHCAAPWAFCQNADARINFWLQWRDVFRSFWAAFGLANIRPFDGFFIFWAGWLILAVWGLLRPSWQNKKPEQVYLLMLLSLLIGTMVLQEWWMRQVLGSYGRLLFPAVGAIALLLVVGWHRLNPAMGRWGWLPMGLLAVVAPFWLIAPAYQLPKSLSAEQLADIQPIGWRFGEFAELWQLQPLARSVPAGGHLPVQLCWRTLALTPQDYTLFIQLIGPNNGLAAYRRTYPGLGSYPTSVWMTADGLPRLFCDRVEVPIPKTLDQTLVYQLEVGWLDEATGARVPAWDSAGHPLQVSFAAQVKLIAPDSLFYHQPTTFTSPIQLLEAVFESEWQSGNAYPIQLTWVAPSPLSEDYTVFIHLRQPETGELVAQADAPPLAGWYPTSWWAAGEIIADVHTFSVPATLPAGSYQLVIGWYNPQTGERLGEEQPIGTIELK